MEGEIALFSLFSSIINLVFVLFRCDRMRQDRAAVESSFLPYVVDFLRLDTLIIVFFSHASKLSISLFCVILFPTSMSAFRIIKEASHIVHPFAVAIFFMR